MKACNLSFGLLLAMFLFASCAKQGGNKTLQVSTGFAITSAGFTGGLAVYGESDRGDKISANATSGTTLPINVRDGNWTFYVVGWEGATPLTGATRCGVTSISLDSAKTNIDIDVTTAKCSDPAFNKSGVATNSNGFRPVTVYSCKALYDSALTPITSSSTTTSISTTNFCSMNTSLPIDYRLGAKSFRARVVSNRKDDSSVPSIVSGCFSSSTNEVITSSISLPTAKIPVIIELFPKGNCVGDPISFPFYRGMGEKYEAFDYVLNTNNSSDNVLLLPFNDLRKAYSPFFSLLPYFQCGSTVENFCIPQPTGIGINYYLYQGTEFRSYKIADNDVSCADVTSISVGTGLSYDTSYPCEAREDGTYLRLKETSANACATSCSLSFTIKGVEYGGLTVTTNPNYANDVNFYNNIWRSIGSGSIATTFFSFYDNKDRIYGTLSHAREMLGPDGPGGLFGVDTCASVSAIKEIDHFDDGSYNHYQVEITSTTKSIPAVLCDNATVNNISACQNSSFDKKMTLRILNGLQYDTLSTYYLSCASKIGYIEKQEVRTKSSTRTSMEKELIGWNTQSATAYRFEALQYQLEKDSAGKVLALRSSYDRGMKTAATDFQVESANYDSTLNTSNLYDESLFQSSTQLISSNIIFRNKGIRLNDQSYAGKFFDTNLMEQLLYTPYLAHDSHMAINANGDIVKAWVSKLSGQNIVYVATYTASTNTWTLPNSSAVSGTGSSSRPRVAIDNNGNIVVAWLETDATSSNTTRVYAKIKKNGVWGNTTAISLYSSTATAPYGGEAYDINVCMNNNSRSAIVWTQDDKLVARKRVSAVSTSDLTSWTLQTDLNTDAISSSAYVANNPACAINSNNEIAITWIQLQTPNTVKVTSSSLPISVSNLVASTVTSSLATMAPVETHIKATVNNSFIVSYFDAINMRIFKSTKESGTSWIHPSSISDGIAGLQGQNNDFCKSTSGGLNTPITCSSITTPATQPQLLNAVGKNNLGLTELRPLRVLGNFTNYETFKGQ